MSYYDSEKDPSSGFGKYVGLFIAAIIIIFALDQCSIVSDRERQNMVAIDSTYVYDENTLIIYREEITSAYKSTSHATYSVYYNENGNKCKYVDGKFVEIDERTED